MSNNNPIFEIGQEVLFVIGLYQKGEKLHKKRHPIRSVISVIWVRFELTTIHIIYISNFDIIIFGNYYLPSKGGGALKDFLTSVVAPILVGIVLHYSITG